MTRLRPLGAAWQPLTGRGIAALALASPFRLLGFQLGFALLTGAAFSFCLMKTWAPAWEEALSVLPNQAYIRQGRLEWPIEPARRLGQTPWLDLVVHPTVTTANPFGQASDIQIALRPLHWRVHGMFGHIEITYPTAWHIPLGRLEARAWWLAWRDLIWVVVAVSLAVVLIVCWWILALIYTPIAWFLGRFFEKFFSVDTALQLGATALLSASLVLTGAVVAYAFRWIPLPALAAAFLLQFIIGWIGSVWGILHCDPKPTTASGKARRPASAQKPSSRKRPAKVSTAKSRSRTNPFAE